MTGRATATILFTDLVGSTELRSRLGDTAAEELRRRHDDTLSKAVVDHGGRVVKGLGDGIMATFAGAADAVAAAVAIQQSVDRLNRSGKAAAPIEVRIGLSAGDVTLEDEDVHGTPVVEASRLCGAAAGGEILAADLVKALAGSATEAGFASMGPLELKGLAQPVLAVRVEWEPAAASAIPLPTLLANVGRVFVGRDADVERLAQLWKEAAAGERRVALLAGEPGVGKTRLAAELATGAHEQGAVVLAGRCDEDLGVPFQPFVEALQHYAAHASELRLGRYGGELARLVPELSTKAPGLPEPLRSDPETERYRLFDAVAAWLAEVSADDPVLLVLDDVHWAAKPTLLLLRHILRSAESLRLLVVATYRDSEVGRGHPLAELLADLRRVEGVERVRLTGLDQAGVAAFIEAVAGHALAEDDEGLPRAVWTETEGNPFFVAEVLRHLAETVGVEQRDGRWVVTGPVGQLGIPEGVRDVVGRRLSRLSEAANRALWVASVVGLEFDPTVVRMAGDITDEALFSSLEEALAARIVSESGSRYRFGHALVKATLYDEMTSARRLTLHRKVAEAIETINAGDLDDHLPALAHHWARASAPAADTARAVDYATRAGDRALAQLAHDEAVAYYRQALELLDQSGPLTNEEHRCELLILLGEAQRRAGDPRHRETLLTAGNLAQDLGDTARLARAALGNSRRDFTVAYPIDADEVALLEAALEQLGNRDESLRAQLLASLATELYFGGDDRRHAVAQEALGIARRLGDPLSLAQVLATVWFATWDPTGLVDRARLVDELWDRARLLGDHLVQFQAGMALFLTALHRADMARADAGLEASAQVAEALGQPVLRWRVLYSRATRAMAAGRLDDAERLAREAGHVGEALGQPVGIYQDALLAVSSLIRGQPEDAVDLVEASAFRTVQSFRAGLAWAYAELHRRDEAGALIEDIRSQDGFDKIPRNHPRLATLSFLSRASARLNHAEWAAELYDLLRPNSGEIVAVPAVWYGAVDHDLGLLAVTLGRHDGADRHFAEAAEIQRRIGARATLAHTRLDWARMLLIRRQPGDTDRASELLDEALTTARDLGLGGVERQAVALLGELP